MATTESFVKSLAKNEAIMSALMAQDDTVVYRKILTGGRNPLPCMLIFIDGMVATKMLDKNVIRRLLIYEPQSRRESVLIKEISQQALTGAAVRVFPSILRAVQSLLEGNALLFAEGVAAAISIECKGYTLRAITESQTETVIRGPREAFIEHLLTNLTLIRRRILTPDLKFEFMRLGARTNTRICLVYVDSLVQSHILAEVKKRLSGINLDGILDTGYIEEFIQDAPLSLFKTVGSTERPDVVAGRLLEGRVALVCDGTPVVLTMPHLFIEYFQASEDYYNRYYYATFTRIIRLIGYFFTTSLPAIYVAIVTYHQEILPMPLMLAVLSSRKGVPFPTIFEAFVMIFFFEAIKEAGVRLPGNFGQAVSIVGALVMGDAAVNAKLISAPMVIIAALTGVTSFLVPKGMDAVGVIRALLLLFAAVLGLYGYVFAIAGVILYLCTMRSFGVPYMLDTSYTERFAHMKDSTMRVPWWKMRTRPRFITWDRIRQGYDPDRKKG
jgi:spore germination protein KA